MKRLLFIWPIMVFGVWGIEGPRYYSSIVGTADTWSGEVIIDDKLSGEGSRPSSQKRMNDSQTLSPFAVIRSSRGIPIRNLPFAAANCHPNRSSDIRKNQESANSIYSSGSGSEAEIRVLFLHQELEPCLLL